MAKVLTKSGQNSCFLKKVWPKIQNVLTMVIHIFIEVSKCFKGVIFLPKNSGLAKKASFDPNSTISAMNSKLPVTTYLSLF